MKVPIKARIVQSLMDVARRYSVNTEYATIAAAYVVFLSVRQGRDFLHPSIERVVEHEDDIPPFVKTYLVSSLAAHWEEYQRAAGTIDEESLIDFFSNEATMLLMESRRDFSAHPIIDQLCVGLLDIAKGNTVVDLNCGIGKFVRKAWFALWNANGSDEGLSVLGLSHDVEMAALTYMVCDVTGIGVKVVAQSIFVEGLKRCDRVMMIPPFGVETRAINTPMVQQVLAAHYKDFPEFRITTAEWVFAARAATLMAPGGRAVVAVPIHALRGTQSRAYREFMVRNQLIDAVVSIPRGFLNGTTVAFALIVLREGSREIKFIDGEEYLKTGGGYKTLDVCRLLKDYHALNDYDAVTTKSTNDVFEKECVLTPDFYLGEDLVYNTAKPLGDIVLEIRRGAKLSVDAWKKVEGDDSSMVRKVAFKHFSDGLIDENLPGLVVVPVGCEDAVLEAGDLIISRMGIPFKVAVVEPRHETLVADENVWIVRMGGDKVLAYYLRAYLESERGTKWLSRLSAGSTLRTISAKNIEKIPVPDADEKTRNAIAYELEKTTILVKENRKRLDDALAAMKNVFDNLNKDGGL